MRYDREYRRGRGPRARGGEVDYGWGVPVHGMYDYSLDYGGLSGPEAEDSETIPPYDGGPDDWTGPRPRRPRYESHHWAAAEPAGEARYRGQERGSRGYDRDFASFRSALHAARARARRGYARDYEEHVGMRGRGPAPTGASAGGWFDSRGGWAGAGGGYGADFADRPGRARGSSFGPGRAFGSGGRRWGGGGRRRSRGMPDGGWAEPGTSGWRAGAPGDDWPGRRPGAGYGREYREQWGGEGPGWHGSEAEGRGQREREWGLGRPRQARPYEPARKDVKHWSRGPRGRWGPYA